MRTRRVYAVTNRPPYVDPGVMRQFAFSCLLGLALLPTSATARPAAGSTKPATKANKVKKRSGSGKRSKAALPTVKPSGKKLVPLEAFDDEPQRFVLKNIKQNVRLQNEVTFTPGRMAKAQGFVYVARPSYVFAGPTSRNKPTFVMRDDSFIAFMLHPQWAAGRNIVVECTGELPSQVSMSTGVAGPNAGSAGSMQTTTDGHTFRALAVTVADPDPESMIRITVGSLEPDNEWTLERCHLERI